jgi:hypothetical protein
MKETGRVFSTEMVRAISHERKTQTRILIDPKAEIKFFPGDNICVFKGKKINGEYCRFAPHEPYHVGDRMYVREAYSLIAPDHVVYRADYFESTAENVKWKPSLLMPKKYARLWLGIRNVSVQKISDITDIDAVKEGFTNRQEFLSYMIARYGNDVISAWCWVNDFIVDK